MNEQKISWKRSDLKWRGKQAFKKNYWSAVLVSLVLAIVMAQQDPDVILVSEEVGYGIVPADAFERQYREAVGRVCTALAAKSRRVTRVVCGIGTVLKDD